MDQLTSPLRRYRATLIPKTISADEAELKADQGVLPFVQFKASNADCAMLLANAITGLPVIRVERRDEVAA